MASDSEDETLQEIADRNRERRKKQNYRGRQSETEKERLREIDRINKQKSRALSAFNSAVSKFEKELMDIAINTCPQCNERYPDIEIKCGMCKRCRLDKGDPRKFSARNGMDPGEQPQELKGLTPIEEMIIAKCSPIVKVYKLKGGQVSYGGHVITFTQDVQQFVNTLPRHPSQLGVIIVRRTFSDGHFDFKVKRKKILEALMWLKHNNIYYKDITIDQDTLNLIPDDGDISHMIPSISTEVETAENDSNEEYYESHVTRTVFQSEQNMLAESLNGLVLDKDTPVDWPRHGDSPIHEFTTIGYIAQCFPSLYPYGRSDYNAPRIRKICPQEYFHHLFRYSDGRFARHNTFRYFALNSIMRWSALTDGSIYYNKSRNSLPPTISELRQSLQDGQLKRLAEKMIYFGKNLRGTKQFWFQRQRELLAMVRNLGCPTYFFTLSAADFHWKPLHQLLLGDNSSEVNSINIRRRAVIENPGITSWFIHKRMSLFMKTVINKVMPYKDFWYRYEWQHRGTGHIHGFLWLESAPKVDELDFNDAEVRKLLCEFHDYFASTNNPAPGLPPGPIHPCQQLYSECEDVDLDYAELVNRVQLHTKCSKNYCLGINKKTKLQQCRFGYPKDLLEETVIELNDSGPTITTARNDPLVNSHNRQLLQAWRANMDIKPVVSSEFVIRYASKYCTKSEVRSNNLQEVMLKLSEGLDRETSVKQLAQKMLIHSVGERDYSAQEACHLLQSLPLYHSSRGYVTINTFYDALSFRVKKRQVGITDGILDTSNLVHIYMYRPNNLEFNSMNLLDFATNYRKVKDEIRLRKPGKEAVVIILPYIQKNETDPNYCRQFLYLHKPFRDEEPMEEEIVNYVDKYQEYILSNPDIQHTSIREELSDDDDECEFEEEPQQNQVQWMALAGLHPDQAIFNGIELGSRPVDALCNWDEIREAYTDWQDMPAFIQREKQNNGGEITMDVPLYEFSKEQKKAFDLVANHYEAQIRSNECEQLRLIVQGVAGTGKSHLIDRIRQHLKNTSILVDSNVLEVVAYTGVAAFNVRGETLHSFLQLPINASQFKELSGSGERRLQERLAEVKYVIIDEMSMIGCRMLGMVNRRLKQGKPGTQHLAFGGLNMILMGDHAQLPPLFDLPLYSTPPLNANPLTIDGFSLYYSFDKAVILSHCYRQSGTSLDEIKFREVLMRLRDGANTEEDWKFLLQRSKHNLLPNEIRIFDESLRLFTTNEQCNKYNLDRLCDLKQPIVKMESINLGKEAYRAEKDIAGGLERTIYLCKNSNVMLTSNLWKIKGLVNGALGIVRDIIFPPDYSPGDLPLCVLVEFKHYTGCGYVTGSKIVPIPVLKHTWTDASGGGNSRSQIPLVLGFGITIHKSQGLTLTKLVLDIGNREFAIGLAYVGLSRVKTYTNLMFDSPFDFERLTSIRKSKRFQERIREEARLRLMSCDTK